MDKVFKVGGHIEMMVESFKRNIGENGLIDDILASIPIYFFDSSLCLCLFLVADDPSYVHLSFTSFTLTDKGIVNLIKIEANIESVHMKCS